jgi:hypothetical protein
VYLRERSYLGISKSKANNIRTAKSYSRSGGQGSNRAPNTRAADFLVGCGGFLIPNYPSIAREEQKNGIDIARGLHVAAKTS